MRPLLLCVSLVVLTLPLGCSPPAPKCDPQSCAGCCDDSGECNLGNAVTSCGSQGAACKTCQLAESCTLGQCFAAATGGGGGAQGGGGGTTDGGTGGGDAGTGGGTGGGTGDCVEDSDCPDPLYFFCNTVTSQCAPACRAAAQCNPPSAGGTRPAEYALDFCSGPLGCQCDEGQCAPSLCSADSDCGAQVCRSGTCVAPPVASSVARCQVSPDFVVFRQGSRARFWVSAWDAQNNPVVLRGGATWTAVGAALTGSGMGSSLEFTAGNAPVATPASSVQAAIGTVTCQARALVLPNPTAGQAAVSVIDELSGRPVAGAKVLLSSTAGAVIPQGAGDTVDTDARGFAALALTGAPASYSVSVFHPDYSYLTVANYAGTSRFLSFALRRNPQDQYGGYKGGFANVPMTSNIHRAMAATSVGGDLSRARMAQVQGPMVPTDIVIGSAINQQDAPIPAGIFLGFGDQPIKSEIAAQGLNGSCLDSTGNPDEARIAAGTCATRSAWALASDVPLGDLPIDVIAGGLENANLPLVVERIAPTFKRINSSIVRDVQFTLRATPFVDAGVPNFSDQSQYTTVNHDFTQVRAAFDFAVRLPVLPRLKGSFLPAAMIFGGAHAPGRGVLALGLGLGADAAPLDGMVNTSGLPSGSMRVRMAPAHHGVEGAPYGLLVSALTSRCLRDAVSQLVLWSDGPPQCEAVSAIVSRLPGNRLAFDQGGLSPVDLTGQPFPAFPEGSRFNFSSAPDGAIPARSFRLGTLLTGLSVARISFADALDTRWEVVVDAASPNFTLPAVPGVLRDRLFSNGNGATGARSDLTVQALRLRQDPAVSTSPPLTFTDFVEFNETNADRTTDFLTGYSTLDYGSPLIAFTTPALTPATISRGSRLVLRVRDFSIGTTPGVNDGVVKLSFTGGTGCVDVTLATEVPQPGSGQVEHALPTACLGTGVAIRAELVKVDGITPLAPAVASTITATIL